MQVVALPFRYCDEASDMLTKPPSKRACEGRRKPLNLKHKRILGGAREALGAGVSILSPSRASFLQKMQAKRARYAAPQAYRFEVT